MSVRNCNRMYADVLISGIGTKIGFFSRDETSTVKLTIDCWCPNHGGALDYVVGELCTVQQIARAAHRNSEQFYPDQMRNDTRHLTTQHHLRHSYSPPPGY